MRGAQRELRCLRALRVPLTPALSLRERGLKNETSNQKSSEESRE